MKSTRFDLRFPRDIPVPEEGTEIKFPVATLPAYAIEYSEFTVRGGFYEDKELVEGQDYLLQDDGVVWKGFFSPKFPGMDCYRLTIHYHGIRDYSLLFPQVSPAELRTRLGSYYEEAETCFDGGAWLSFALMCGAVYEGLLYAQFRKDWEFRRLIQHANSTMLVDEPTAKIMDDARDLRNLVHANRYATPYVSRKQAMDMRTVMDKLIKRNWTQGAEL
jgi:hypothetical protein